MNSSAGQSETEGILVEELSRRPLVLASGSRYRARMLTEAGIPFVVDPPEVDERALDPLFEQLGPEGFALHLGRLKSADVSRRHPNSIVVAGDQVGVLTTRTGPRQLTKQADVDSAVAQLMEMGGTTHALVNGLVAVDTSSGRTVEGLDTVRVTMRSFTEAEARRYVERFEPFDCAGSYRIEDQAEMQEGEGFILGIDGEDASGVKGLPLPLLRRMLTELLS